jgi:hypothetical protein
LSSVTAVERAAVGAGDGLGGGEDRFQQPVDVALGGERGADRVELLQALAQVVGTQRSEAKAGAGVDEVHGAAI